MTRSMTVENNGHCCALLHAACQYASLNVRGACRSSKQARRAVCRKCFMFHVDIDRDRSRRSSCTCAIMRICQRSIGSVSTASKRRHMAYAAVACYTSLPTPSKSKRSAFHLTRAVVERSKKTPSLKSASLSTRRFAAYAYFFKAA